MSYNYEIIICTSCNGKGVYEREELVNHHKGEYDYWTEDCGFLQRFWYVEENNYHYLHTT